MTAIRVIDSFGNSLILDQNYVNILLQYSLYVQNLFDIQEETKDEYIDIFLYHECTIQIVEILCKFILNFEHMQYFATLEMTQHLTSITKLMDFFMLDSSFIDKTNELLDEYKNCTWNELVESNDLETTFHNAYFYIQPRLRVLPFHVFMNTFVEKHGTYSMDFFYRFLRVYNDYVYRMKNLGYCIFEDTTSIFPYKMQKFYTPEVFEIYESLFFPKHIFCFMDDNYSPFRKILELMNTQHDEDIIRDLHEFMYSFKHHQQVYFCGSSILYMLLRDYDKSNVNDIDIWLNSSHHENHTTHFMKRFTKKVSPTSTHLSMIEKEGILDVQPNQAQIKLQYIHVQNKSAIDVINHFDLPCVSAYYQFDNQNETNEILCLTTHFIESILQKKIFDFYNWKSVFHCDLYRLQTRILKYQSRGFELSPTLLSKIEHVQRPRDIQHKTIIKCCGEIPHNLVNRIRQFNKNIISC